MRFLTRLPFFLVGLFCLGCSSQSPIDGLGDTQYDRPAKIMAEVAKSGTAQLKGLRETQNRKSTFAKDWKFRRAFGKMGTFFNIFNFFKIC